MTKLCNQTARTYEQLGQEMGMTSKRQVLVWPGLPPWLQASGCVHWCLQPGSLHSSASPHTMASLCSIPLSVSAVWDEARSGRTRHSAAKLAPCLKMAVFTAETKRGINWLHLTEFRVNVGSHYHVFYLISCANYSCYVIFFKGLSTST